MSLICQSEHRIIRKNLAEKEKANTLVLPQMWRTNKWILCYRLPLYKEYQKWTARMIQCTKCSVKNAYLLQAICYGNSMYTCYLNLFKTFFTSWNQLKPIATLEANAMASSKPSQNSSSNRGKIKVDGYVHDVSEVKILQTGNWASRYFDFKYRKERKPNV